MWDVQTCQNIEIFCSFAYRAWVFLYNYFNSPTKLFSDLYLAKFLDISVKSFFSCDDDFRLLSQPDLDNLIKNKLFFIL